MKLSDQSSAGGLILRAFGTTDRARELALYEKWMGSEPLRYETATDEMTAAEIEEMQGRWLTAPDMFNYLIWLNGIPIGDIGLFFKTDENGNVDTSVGEISMMIAEPSYRRAGHGAAAHRLCIAAAQAALGTRKIIAKIKDDNDASIKFFERLGYRQTERSQIFREVTLEHTLETAPLPV